MAFKEDIGYFCGLPWLDKKKQAGWETPPAPSRGSDR